MRKLIIANHNIDKSDDENYTKNQNIVIWNLANSLHINKIKNIKTVKRKNFHKEVSKQLHCEYYCVML